MWMETIALPAKPGSSRFRIDRPESATLLAVRPQGAMDFGEADQSSA
jgi:hypothetical protein